MQLPETPERIEDLDLLKRLKAYADGTASWLKDRSPLGINSKRACEILYADLSRVSVAVDPLLTKVTAKEMDTFTMHDPVHVRKVAHLMWHILDEKTRERLTPPEIALLVCSAYIHDLGMFLSNEEREKRLAPESDLWERLEIDEEMRQKFEELRAACRTSATAAQQRALRKLFEAEEALLCQDTRERHATRERFESLLSELQAFHVKEPQRIPDIEACLSFDGDSFKDKLIEICVSHNEDGESLVRRDEKNPAYPRFGREYPIGLATADLHMVAATLRLADILDFDRERTPPVIYHYFLPGSLDPAEDVSAREWGKHFSISNWQIDDDAIVFRGQCKNHIIHHAVVQFCETIAREIEATRATFGALQDGQWPFRLPSIVKNDIQSIGYHYVPYRFELDDERIYGLLMGGAIYNDPIVAVRELVQNAVDACKLRDQQERIYNPGFLPANENRIYIKYEEPTANVPYSKLTVQDTGTGMDALIIERFFLKVGRSYYRSAEFDRIRIELRKHDLDFAPVSEFGIGFLSCFLLADRIEVETAMWESLRGDTRKRVIEIHGPTRLIRLNQSENVGPRRFKGTRISLTLVRGGQDADKGRPLSWNRIREYLEDICLDLPYSLHLQHIQDGRLIEGRIDPKPISVVLSKEQEPFYLRIPLNDNEAGLEGEIALQNSWSTRVRDREIAEQFPARVADSPDQDVSHRFSEWRKSSLLRGGFKVGQVPGLPSSSEHFATIRLTWQSQQNRRYVRTNLARNSTVNEEVIAERVMQNWVGYLVRTRNGLAEGQLYYLTTHGPRRRVWGQWLEEFDAITLYETVRDAWCKEYSIKTSALEKWEAGIGPSLRLNAELDYATTLADEFLNCILPIVTSLQLGWSTKLYQAATYVKPPTPNWREELRASRDYVRQPRRWGRWIEYTDSLSELLFVIVYRHVRYLNVKYRDMWSRFFTEEDLDELTNAILKWTDLRDEKKQLLLSPREFAVLSRARETIGDLRYGKYGDSWPIDSIPLPTSTGNVESKNPSKT